MGSAIATGTPDPDEPIDGYTSDEEAEYQQFVAEMQQQFPAIPPTEIDFSRLVGKANGRTGKAIVLYLTCKCGWSIDEIATAIGRTPVVVSRYLSEAVREQLTGDDPELSRKLELMKLDSQRRDCVEQFGRSCEDAVETHEVIDKEGEIRELKTIKPQSGNPSYQKILIEISKRVAALEGLDAPTKAEVSKTEQKLIINQITVRTREKVEAARAAGLLK